MSNYDNYDVSERFRNLTAAYKPRPWGEDINMNTPILAKPVKIATTKIFIKKEDQN